MSLAKQRKIELIETRWKTYGTGEYPRKGEVFVGRRNEEVYDRLFLCVGTLEIVYLSDSSTHLAHGSDWFTHWMPVGEIIE